MSAVPAAPGRRRAPRRAALALLGWALAAFLAATRAGAEVPQPPAAAADVRLDFEVIDRFLEFVGRGDATEKELDGWVRLPGNRELLRQGRIEGGLSPDILKEAARVTLRGEQVPSPPTLGTVAIGEWPSLRRMADSIRARESDLIAATLKALDPYLPRDHPVPPIRIYFHLGGSWDGKSSDAVYINLTLFQSRGEASLAGLDALLVHETFHQVQGVLLPRIEDYSSRQSALYTVLLRMQQEGTARHLEYRYLRPIAPAEIFDRTNLERYAVGLRHAAEHSEALENIRVKIAAGRLDEARVLASAALAGGGPLYALGHGIADAIEEGSGREALARTVAAGPLAFLAAYEEAVRGRGATLLPAGLGPDLDSLVRGYGRDPALASQRRRQGLVLLSAGDRSKARSTLEEAIRLDPTDATSAYNLACAFALEGRTRKALKWLEEAFERGFDNYKHAALDEDLETLRDEPKFEALLRARGFKYRRPARSTLSP